MLFNADSVRFYRPTVSLCRSCASAAKIYAIFRGQAAAGQPHISWKVQAPAGDGGYLC